MRTIIFSLIFGSITFGQSVTSVKDLGAKGDGRTIPGCSMTSGSTTLTCPSAETQRLKLNFVNGTGTTVSCSDDAGNTSTDCAFDSSLNPASPGMHGGTMPGDAYFIAVSTNGVINAISPAYGLVADGRTVTDGVMSYNSATLTSSSASFTSADAGKYISVAGCGASSAGFPVSYYGGLGTTIASVTNSTTAVLGAVCNNSSGVSGATVTLGTDNYAAFQALAAYATANDPGEVDFPPGMYVIGTHKTAANSCTSTTQDIQWSNLHGTVISGYAGTIYLDGSFSQTANCSSAKSSNNMVTPFLVQDTVGVVLQGFTIIGNKDLTVRASGVTSESLTSFCVAIGGSTGSSDYTLKDLSCSEPQTDCYYVGIYNAGDTNATLQNDTCAAPARGNFSVGAITGLHMSGVHGSNAGAGSYGGFQPFHCVDIEPNLPTDNIVFDGASSCTNDIGWEFTVSSAILVGHVTVKDSLFSWNNSTKQQGFNVNSVT